MQVSSERSTRVRCVDSLLVIANSEAGSDDQEALEAALTVLRGGASVDLCQTASADELDDVLAQAGSRRIVIAGGDGSLHAVISALHRRNQLEDTVVGLLPLGTGNDFARGLEIPLDSEAAARVVLVGEPRRMDLVLDDEGGVVVNGVHVGAGAEASRKGARLKKRFGRIGYPVGAAMTAARPPTLRLRVEVDGELVRDLDEPVLQVAVGNGPSVGGGTELTPEAVPHDGKLDVMVSRSTGPLARFLYAARLGFATHHERDDVSYLRGSRVSISGGPFWCSADGELSGPVHRRSWRVEPGAYSLVLP